MANTPEQAIANAADQSAHGPRFGVGECLRQVRTAYGVPSDGTPDAATAWMRSTAKHGAPADLAAIPRGALLFWLGGTHGYGHVAICAGGGKMWSTDIERPGYFDLAPIDQVRKSWGLRLAGWTEDVDGVHVFTPKHPHPLVKAAVHSDPGAERVAAMRRLAEHGAPRVAAKARVWLRAHDDKARVMADLRRVGR